MYTKSIANVEVKAVRVIRVDDVIKYANFHIKFNLKKDKEKL